MLELSAKFGCTANATLTGEFSSISASCSAGSSSIKSLIMWYSTSPTSHIRVAFVLITDDQSKLASTGKYNDVPAIHCCFKLIGPVSDTAGGLTVRSSRSSISLGRILDSPTDCLSIGSAAGNMAAGEGLIIFGGERGRDGPAIGLAVLI